MTTLGTQAPVALTIERRSIERRSPRRSSLVGALTATHFVSRAGGVARAFLVLYLSQERALSPTTAGAVVAAVGIGDIGSQLLGGWLGDRTGRRHTILDASARDGRRRPRAGDIRCGARPERDPDRRRPTHCGTAARRPGYSLGSGGFHAAGRRRRRTRRCRAQRRRPCRVDPRVDPRPDRRLRASSHSSNEKGTVQ
jgi:hypothetical protein